MVVSRFSAAKFEDKTRLFLFIFATHGLLLPLWLDDWHIIKPEKISWIYSQFEWHFIVVILNESKNICPAEKRKEPTAVFKNLSKESLFYAINIVKQSSKNQRPPKILRIKLGLHARLWRKCSLNRISQLRNTSVKTSGLWDLGQLSSH